MRRKITATFADGTTIARSTEKLPPLTHAWRLTYLRPLDAAGKVTTRSGVALPDGTSQRGELTGFSSSAALASKAAGTEANRLRGLKTYGLQTYTEIATEVVPAVE